MAEEERCRRMQRLRVRNIAYTIAHGIELNFSGDYILEKIDEQDKFWREGLEMTECPTDLEIDNAVAQLKKIVTKVV